LQLLSVDPDLIVVVVVALVVPVLVIPVRFPVPHAPPGILAVMLATIAPVMNFVRRAADLELKPGICAYRANRDAGKCQQGCGKQSDFRHGNISNLIIGVNLRYIYELL
jgi:hypothetical protein